MTDADRTARLRFIAELEELMAESGETRGECFDRMNGNQMLPSLGAYVRYVARLDAAAEAWLNSEERGVWREATGGGLYGDFTQRPFADGGDGSPGDIAELHTMWQTEVRDETWRQQCESRQGDDVMPPEELPGVYYRRPKRL